MTLEGFAVVAPMVASFAASLCFLRRAGQSWGQALFGAALLLSAAFGIFVAGAGFVRRFAIDADALGLVWLYPVAMIVAFILVWRRASAPS